jgi:hypothetical protein
MAAESQNTPGIRVIPPLIFLAALVAAALVDWFWPVGVFPDAVRYWLGPIILIVSLVVIIPTIRSFKRAKTPFDVRRAASHW